MQQIDAGAAQLTARPASVDARPPTPAPAKRRRSWLRGLLRQRLALTGLLIVAIYVVLALVGAWIAPYSFSAQHVPDRLNPPGGAYLLGTDEFGRDILSRLLFGAGISFQVGVIAV